MTETENKALDLAKRVFEYFTRDALPFAREILSLEKEMGASILNGHNGSSQDIQKTNGHPVNGHLTDFPVTDITAFVPEGNGNAGTINYARQEELVYDPADDLPF
jgi:hypothetical protein